MEGAAKECITWVDRRTVERELQYSKPNHGMDNNSFDAVGFGQKEDRPRRSILHIQNW